MPPLRSTVGRGVFEHSTGGRTCAQAHCVHNTHKMWSLRMNHANHSCRHRRRCICICVYRLTRNLTCPQMFCSLMFVFQAGLSFWSSTWHKKCLGCNSASCLSSWTQDVCCNTFPWSTWHINTDVRSYLFQGLILMPYAWLRDMSRGPTFSSLSLRNWNNMKRSKTWGYVFVIFLH